MAAGQNPQGRSAHVTHVPVDMQTRVLILESRARELREQQAFGNLTELQNSLIHTELDLLRIALEHCHALLGLEQIFDGACNIDRAECESLDRVLVS